MEMFVYQMANMEVLSQEILGRNKLQFDFAELNIQFFLHMKCFHRNVMLVKS